MTDYVVPVPQPDAEPTDAERRTFRLLWLALAGFTITWFALLGGRALFNPDEGRYAEIPREMLATGDWIVPRLNGLVYIEKPPLQYWGSAIALQVFGLNEIGGRLYNGLAGFLTVLLTAWFAQRLWGRAAGWRAGVIVASSLLVVLMGHVVTLDMSLTLFMCLTLFAFCLAQRHRDERERARRWMWLAYAGGAAAVLTKGIVALALPGLTLIVYSLMQRDSLVWKRLALLTGLPLFLVLAVPWFVLIQREVPQFFDFFFIREHFARYLTRISDRYEPWWFFIEVLALGCLPWLLPTLRAIFGGWKREAEPGEFDVRRLLWAWTIVVLLFFSASDSKLIPYILPVFPTLAVLMATADEGAQRRDLRRTAWILIVGGVAFVAVAALLPQLLAHSSRAPYWLPTRIPAFLMGAALLAGGLAARRRDRDSTALTAYVGTAAYAAFALLLYAATHVAPLYSGRDLVEQLPREMAESPDPMYSVRTYDHSLTFYLRREATLVEYRGELDFGLTLRPERELGFVDWIARWKAERQALAVMDDDTYEFLKNQGVPMVLRAQNPKRMIVSRR